MCFCDFNGYFTCCIITFVCYFIRILIRLNVSFLLFVCVVYYVGNVIREFIALYIFRCETLVFVVHFCCEERSETLLRFSCMIIVVLFLFLHLLYRPYFFLLKFCRTTFTIIKQLVILSKFYVVAIIFYYPSVSTSHLNTEELKEGNKNS